MSLAKDKKDRRKISTGICIAVVVFIFALVMTFIGIRKDKTFAASGFGGVESCLNQFFGGAAPTNSNQSVLSACEDCQRRVDSGRTSNLGAMWFNNEQYDNKTSIIKVDSWDNKVIDIYLHTSVYSCTSTVPADKDFNAYYIWIGKRGVSLANTNTFSGLNSSDLPSYLEQGSGSLPNIYRGSWTSAWGWANTTNSTVHTMKMDLEKFYDEAKALNKTSAWNTMDDGCAMKDDGSGKERCILHASVNRCFSDNGGYNKGYDDPNRIQPCDGDNTTIIVEIPPKPLDSGFTSKSKVRSDSGSSESPDWGVNAPDLEVEADSESKKATVYFSHKLQFTPSASNGTYNEASTTWKITVDDGNDDEWSDTWTTSGNSVAESNWLPETGELAVTITVGESDAETGAKVCSIIEYDPKLVQWDNNSPRNMIQNNDPNNTGTTQACAIVKLPEEQEEEVGYVEFWSQSYVQTPAEKDVPAHDEWTAEKTTGDEVTLQLSTDYETGHAKIGHQMSYELHLNEGITIGSNDKVSDDICTTWTVIETGESDKYCYKVDSTPKKVAETDYPDISVPGSKKEKIEYESKKVGIKRKELKDGPCGTIPETNSCAYNPARYKYSASSGENKGDSAAAIEFKQRPDVPGGGGASTTGLVDAGPMGAGESTTMAWGTEAKAQETRRIMEYKAVAFEYTVDANPTKDNKYVEGHRDYIKEQRIKKDPCTYWGQYNNLRNGNSGCAQADNVAESFLPNGHTSTHTYDDGSRNMVVPNYVGDIYCTSFGYRWEYWYGVKHTKGPDTGIKWAADTGFLGYSYWTHYDAACRSIAKKPSISIWNSSIFAGQGDILTSIAPRYNETAIGRSTSDGGELKRFGSWTEYLAVLGNGAVRTAGDSSIGFASGAAISLGTTDNNLLKNSPLTISNENNPVGASNIKQNLIYQNRLGNYLWNSDPMRTEKHSIKIVDSISEIGSALSSGFKTVIVNHTGSNLAIGNSIKLSDYSSNFSSFTTIYDLPQIILYVPSGNVEIGSSVTQIDAWIIAPNGKVETCSNFRNNETEAKVKDWTGADECSSQLKINGPVIAKSIDPKRTYGAERLIFSSEEDTDTANTPPQVMDTTHQPEARSATGDVFNLSADVYLWSYAQASRYDSSYTEAYIRELPPRY